MAPSEAQFKRLFNLVRLKHENDGSIEMPMFSARNAPEDVYRKLNLAIKKDLNFVLDKNSLLADNKKILFDHRLIDSLRAKETRLRLRLVLDAIVASKNQDLQHKYIQFIEAGNIALASVADKTLIGKEQKTEFNNNLHRNKLFNLLEKKLVNNELSNAPNIKVINEIHDEMLSGVSSGLVEEERKEPLGRRDQPLVPIREKGQETFEQSVTDPEAETISRQIIGETIEGAVTLAQERELKEEEEPFLGKPVRQSFAGSSVKPLIAQEKKMLKLAEKIEQEKKLLENTIKGLRKRQFARQLTFEQKKKLVEFEKEKLKKEKQLDVLSRRQLTRVTEKEKRLELMAKTKIKLIKAITNDFIDLSKAGKLRINMNNLQPIWNEYERILNTTLSQREREFIKERLNIVQPPPSLPFMRANQPSFIPQPSANTRFLKNPSDPNRRQTHSSSQPVLTDRFGIHRSLTDISTRSRRSPINPINVMEGKTTKIFSADAISSELNLSPKAGDIIAKELNNLVPVFTTVSTATSSEDLKSKIFRTIDNLYSGSLPRRDLEFLTETMFNSIETERLKGNVLDIDDIIPLLDTLDNPNVTLNKLNQIALKWITEDISEEDINEEIMELLTLESKDLDLERNEILAKSITDKIVRQSETQSRERPPFDPSTGSLLPTSQLLADVEEHSTVLPQVPRQTGRPTEEEAKEAILENNAISSSNFDEGKYDRHQDPSDVVRRNPDENVPTPAQEFSTRPDVFDLSDLPNMWNNVISLAPSDELEHLGITPTVVTNTALELRLLGERGLLRRDVTLEDIENVTGVNVSHVRDMQRIGQEFRDRYSDVSDLLHNPERNGQELATDVINEVVERGKEAVINQIGDRLALPTEGRGVLTDLVAMIADAIKQDEQGGHSRGAGGVGTLAPNVAIREGALGIDHNNDGQLSQKERDEAKFNKSLAHINRYNPLMAETLKGTLKIPREKLTPVSVDRPSNNVKLIQRGVGEYKQRRDVFNTSFS
jgi:hypothetical protein